ncbi:hypothetical protein [Erythrobacter rubeus]|uniref:Uncharacterized protein n=1 Tax=Erythrobacter rubeus TaxID=2760803 RepID=A0ABR8KNF2_9SPHN|nr:hypothetical protein [Erythrobacter rubeus]MBD2842169.1 hypothetical protein [Erythrobacter rubeus]
MTSIRVFAQCRTEHKNGHRGYLSPSSASRTVDNQEAVVSAMLQERARRALYADCDRAPLGWEIVAV